MGLPSNFQGKAGALNTPGRTRRWAHLQKDYFKGQWIKFDEHSNYLQ